MHASVWSNVFAHRKPNENRRRNLAAWKAGGRRFSRARSRAFSIRAAAGGLHFRL
jgi:hypothetical protein